MTVISSSGPLPQLPPTASAPHAVSDATACSGRDAHHRVAARVEGHRGDQGDPGRHAPDALDGGLDLGQVGHRLDPDEVDATGHERGSLLGEDVDRLVVVERPGRGEDRAARTDVAGDQRVATGRIDLAAQEDRGGLVELGDAVLEAVQAEPHPVATERVGHEDLRPGVEVAAMDPADDVRLGQVPDLGRVAEHQAVGEEHRAHRAVGEDRPVGGDQLAPALARGPAIGAPSLLDPGECRGIERFRLDRRAVKDPAWSHLGVPLMVGDRTSVPPGP